MTAVRGRLYLCCDWQGALDSRHASLAALCRRDPELPATLRAVAPIWIVQMPWLLSEAHRAALQRELVGAHQARMLRELLERLMAQAPLVVVLEDLHWSDLDTAGAPSRRCATTST